MTSSKLEDIKLLECNKCQLENVSHKIMKYSCGHNICQKCSFTYLLLYISKITKGLSSNYNRNQTFECFVCNNGNSSITINEYFNSTVMKKSFTQNLYGKCCDACDSFELKSYCYQCKSYFCKKCIEKVHNYIIPFRLHNLTDNLSEFPDKIICNSCEDDKEIYYLCCDRFLCEICIVRFHLTHSFKFIYNDSNNDEYNQLLNNINKYFDISENEISIDKNNNNNNNNNNNKVTNINNSNKKSIDKEEYTEINNSNSTIKLYTNNFSIPNYTKNIVTSNASKKNQIALSIKTNKYNMNKFITNINNNNSLSLNSSIENNNLICKIDLEKYQIIIEEIKNTIKAHYSQNKIMFSNLINDCLNLLNILKNRYKASLYPSNYLYSYFLFFLDTYNKLKNFLKDYHLKYSQDTYTSAVIKIMSKLEKIEDKINSILITEFLNLNIESDEENDTESKYNEELQDILDEIDKQKLVKKKKKLGKLEVISNKVASIEKNSYKFSFSNKSSRKSILGENIINNEMIKKKYYNKTKRHKNFIEKYKLCTYQTASPLSLSCKIIFYDDSIKLSTYPNQFVVFNTLEYRDSLCYINNSDYSIEILDFDYQGWEFDKNYRLRIKNDKIKIKAHKNEIISIKFFVILERYCVVTCSLDQKCRIFNCDYDFENFLTIKCNFKPYSAEMFEVYEEEYESDAGFVAVCGFNKNCPLNIYNTRTINISDESYKSIKIEGYSYNLKHKKTSNCNVILIVSVLNNSKYYLNIYDFLSSKCLNSITVGNFINNFVFRDIVNYGSDKKNILIIFNDRSGTLYEYDMLLGKITNKKKGVGYYDFDVIDDTYIIIGGKKNSIQLINIDTFEYASKQYNNAHLAPVCNIIVYNHEYYGVGIFTLGLDKYFKLLR